MSNCWGQLIVPFCLVGLEPVEGSKHQLYCWKAGWGDAAEFITKGAFLLLPVKHSQTSCFPPSQDVHFSEVLLKPQIPLKKQRSPMARTLSMVAHCWARDFSEEIIKFSSTPEELALRERLLLPRMVGIYPGIGLQQQE